MKQENDEQHVLVVDDTIENLQVVGTVLRDAGYTVTVATSGSQALEILNSVVPDLILLDVTMPEMDGYAVCDLLKTNETTKDIPVIYLTARTEIEDVVKGFEIGAVDFITKPFNSAVLLARVRTHVKLKKTIDSLREAMSSIKTLSGMIPICSNCKSIRNDEGFWEQMEKYIELNSEALFSHSVCPECSDELYGDQEWYQKLKKKKETGFSRET